MECLCYRKLSTMWAEWQTSLWHWHWPTTSHSQHRLCEHCMSTGDVNHATGSLCRPRHRRRRVWWTLQSVVLVVIRCRRLGALNAQSHRMTRKHRFFLASARRQVVLEIFRVADRCRRRSDTAVALTFWHTSYIQPITTMFYKFWNLLQQNDEIITVTRNK